MKKIVSAIAAAAVASVMSMSVFAAPRDGGAVGNVIDAGENIINDIADAGESVVDGVTDAVTGDDATDNEGATTPNGDTNGTTTGNTTNGAINGTTNGTTTPGNNARPETNTGAQTNPSTGVGMSYALVTAAAAALGMTAVAISRRRS